MTKEINIQDFIKNFMPIDVPEGHKKIPVDKPKSEDTQNWHIDPI